MAALSFLANGPAVQRSAHLPRTLTLTNLLLERLPPIHWWGWCRRRFALPSSCGCSFSSQGDLLPFLCGTVIYTICNVTVGAYWRQVEGEVPAIGMAKTYGGVLTYVFSGHLFPLTHTLIHLAGCQVFCRRPITTSSSAISFNARSDGAACGTTPRF